MAECHSEAKPKESKTSLDNLATLAVLFVPSEQMDPSLHYCSVQDDERVRSLWILIAVEAFIRIYSAIFLIVLAVIKFFAFFAETSGHKHRARRNQQNCREQQKLLHNNPLYNGLQTDYTQTNQRNFCKNRPDFLSVIRGGAFKQAAQR